MSSTDVALHPIIYVRGYAMTRGEMDETTADPFCGFNLGSTVYRATPEKDKPAKKFVFESPVVRLGSDFGYGDVFDNGLDIMDSDWEGNPDWNGGIPRQSIIVYRYYEQASNLLGSGKTPEIEEFAKGLSQLVLRVRELVCKNKENTVSLESFRCYLVAHSMGGLVCRAFLQNPALGKEEARQCVDKVFTYATPHNGIEVAGINIPNWLSANDMNNFNRKRMAEYLKLGVLHKKSDRVDWLQEESFPSEKFFCMIGSNRGDYEVAMGASRTFSGHGSDGLVRIENASVWGVNAKGQVSAPCATAYAYRSHSGYFGIINSEESYQNLTRFLFGDVRVDIWLDVKEVRVPTAIQGKDVNALYQFEVLASPRGKRWYLTRRTAEEDSAACRSHKELVDPATKANQRIYLSTVFLSKRARVNPDRPSLAYSMMLGVRVPDYEIERKFWPDGHYEGGYLFRDSVIIEMIPPQEEGADWIVTYDWQRDNRGPANEPLSPKKLKGGKVEITIPFDSETIPGIAGQLRFVVSAWNE
jgi:hypothetical protein